MQYVHVLLAGSMGNVTGRSEPEVHVVVVQPKENSQVNAKVVRQTYRNLRSQRKTAGLYMYM